VTHKLHKLPNTPTINQETLGHMSSPLDLENHAQRY